MYLVMSQSKTNGTQSCAGVPHPHLHITLSSTPPSPPHLPHITLISIQTIDTRFDEMEHKMEAMESMVTTLLRDTQEWQESAKVRPRP